MAPFLEELDDSGSHERWDSQREQAEDVLGRLRNRLFAEEIAREGRRKLYLALKAEFDLEPKPYRLSDCYRVKADCLPEKEPLE